MAEKIGRFKEQTLSEITPPGSSRNGDDPSYMSRAYIRMKELWTLVDDVYTGTLRMRQRRETYLPKFPIESQTAYDARVKKVTLMNVYARTVDAMTGLVVGSGIDVDNLPEKLKPHLANIDNAGTSFEVFVRDTLRDTFAGHIVVLIDMPDVPRPDNATEARYSKIRPYWTRRRPDEIINWRTEVIDGETIVTQITFRECVLVPDGAFGETEEIRYMVWKLVSEVDPQTEQPTGKLVARWDKYREEEGRKANGHRTTEIVQYAGGDTHLTSLPFFVIYGYQDDGKILESKPPLLDLAIKNVEHMQIDSDYKKGLSIAGVALPVLKTGRPAEEVVKVFGWDQILLIDEAEEFDWKEANGNALPNKRIALEDIKREMGVLGLSLIAERSDANITATERLLDSVQQSNQLMSIQASLVQGLRRGFEIHAEWMKIDLPSEVSVALGLDWTEMVRSADHMQTLLEMAKEDFLSTATLLEAANKYGVLPASVKAEDEIARLKKEGRVRQSRMTMKSTAGGVKIEGGKKLDPDESGDSEGDTSLNPSKGE